MAKVTEQIKTDGKEIKNAYVRSLERKAIFLKELLSFVEDKALGFLMETTEKEKNISLSEAKRLLK